LTTAYEFKDIPNFDTFVKIEPLNKGWSDDKKYYIEAADGSRLLLRIADIDEYERKEDEFDMLKQAETLGIPLSTPIDFGTCNNGENVYQILGWVDGEDLRETLPKLSETEKYALGIKAGKLIAKIHSFPAPENTIPWSAWFWAKVTKRIEFYNNIMLRSNQAAFSDKGYIFVDYLLKKRRFLVGRPQTFNHGDVGISNLILMPNGEIAAIDFNCYDDEHGDPWWELDSLFSWGEEPCPHFYTGFIRGYFDGEPQEGFFEVLSYYFAYSALAAICDTSVGEQGKPEDAQRHMENILRWFDNMKNPVPTWYLKDEYGEA